MSLPIHVLLLALITGIAIMLCLLCRRSPSRARPIRLALAYAIAANELIWWTFRYCHEGIRLSNLPLQLCDVTLWAVVAACMVPRRLIVEFAYFAGMAGAGMALLTPDLWEPWPSYPAIYFFVAHGGIVIGAAVLVFGDIYPIKPNSMWRAFVLLIAYASIVGVVNEMAGTNYMYLCRKPGGGSVLDFLGPWPTYLAGGAIAALAMFAVLSVPLRMGPART